MNKAELVSAVADKAGITKAQAAAALDQVLGGIAAALRAGDKVTLVGFGTFSVANRGARTGRNPRDNKPSRSLPRRSPSSSPARSWLTKSTARAARSASSIGPSGNRRIPGSTGPALAGPVSCQHRFFID